ncbi:hypothetical protein GQ457_16G015780 [Hibiscus cannabinus]
MGAELGMIMGVVTAAAMVWRIPKLLGWTQCRLGLWCFLCKGPHQVVDCPKRGSLNALKTTTVEPVGKDDRLDDDEEGPARLGSIRFLYALRSESDKAEFEKERGLMYVDIKVNGVASKALVDTGATDTFITPEEAERCNLKLSKGKGWMKAVNSGAAVVWGSTKNVKTKVGPWEGSMDYTVVPMDDFNVVLGLDFMMANQVVPVSAASCVLFQGDCPGVLAAMVTSKLPSVRGVGAGVVDEDVEKLGGGECCGRPFV